jgi:cytochrome c6
MCYLRGIVVGVVAAGLSAIASAEAPAVDAAALFKRSCAMCHGPDGRAATPAAKKMGVKDLSLTELSSDQVRVAIVDGVKGVKGTMPAFGARFSAAELDALVAHIQSLRTPDLAESA